MVLAALAAAISGTPLQAQTVTAVPQLDLVRYSGAWYEIERYPVKSEKKCAKNALALYTRADKPNHVLLVTSCQQKDGSELIRNASGHTQDKKIADGRLKISFNLLTSTRYWVLALGPESEEHYRYALVGSPNHKFLWIMSRTRTMDPAILAELRAKAAAEGFDPAKLVPSPQQIQGRPPVPASAATLP